MASIDPVLRARVQYYWTRRDARLQAVLKENGVESDVRAGPSQDPEQVIARLEFKALERIEELYRPKLNDLICKRFRYCQRRRESAGFNLAVQLVDWAVAFGLKHKHAIEIEGFPGVATLVFLVQTQALDKWCKCRAKSASADKTPA